MTNIATAEVENKDIEDEVTHNKYISTSVVSKSGSYDELTQTITWTITVNEYGANIAGYTFTDTAFADAVGNITVTRDGVTDTSSEWTYDADTYSYTFRPLSTSTDGGELDTNTNTYTITYTTSVSSTGLGESQKIDNTVSVTDGDDPVADKTASVTVNDENLIGKLSKSVEAGKADSNGNRVLNWTSTFTVPDGGIAKDTVISDYLGTYSGDIWYYVNGAGTTHQWFTYDQIIALYNSGITIGDDTVSTESYTFSAYDATAGKWVTYSDLTDSGTYSSHVFTAYKITFTRDVSYSGELELEYCTTADIASVSTERTYWNNVQVGSLSAAASYTEHKDIYKTDGKGATGTTYRDTTDGTVTWRVYVYIDDDTTGTIEIADTLPTGISLVSASVAYQNTSTVIS